MPAMDGGVWGMSAVAQANSAEQCKQRNACVLTAYMQRGCLGHLTD